MYVYITALSTLYTNTSTCIVMYSLSGKYRKSVSPYCRTDKNISSLQTPQGFQGFMQCDQHIPQPYTEEPHLSDPLGRHPLNSDTREVRIYEKQLLGGL